MFAFLLEADQAPALDSLRLRLLDYFTGRHQLEWSEIGLLNVEFLFIDPIRIVLLLDITMAGLELFVYSLIARVVSIEDRIVKWLDSLTSLLAIRYCAHRAHIITIAVLLHVIDQLSRLGLRNGYALVLRR